MKSQAVEDYAINAAKLLRSLTIVESDARRGGTAPAWLLCDYIGLEPRQSLLGEETKAAEGADEDQGP